MKDDITNKIFNDNLKKIDLMVSFTKEYQNNINEPVAIREAKCLEIQVLGTLCPMEEDHIFAGVVGSLPIGFSPQSDNVQLGYYYSEDEIDQLYTEDLPVDYKNKLYQLKSFWTVNGTCDKIEAAYPKDLAEALKYNDFHNKRRVGYPLFRISGSQLDYGKLLRLGVNGLNELLEKKKVENGDESKFYEGLGIILKIFADSCEHYHKEVLENIKTTQNEKWKNHLIQLEKTLKAIQTQPATSFRDAIQMVLMYWSISGSLNFGRMDTYLASYYVNDIKNGLLSEDEALTLLEGMWRIMALKNKVYDTRVVIGGRGRINQEECDKFSMLAMETSKNVKDVVPQLTLRFDKNTKKEIMDKAYEVIGEGCTFPLLYNDDINIKSVKKAFNLADEEAVDYCPFGCGEYVIFKKSLGTPSGLINLAKALEVTLNNGYDMTTNEKIGIDVGDIKEFNTFDELLSAYKKQVEYFVDFLAVQEEIEYVEAGKDAGFLFFSLLYDDCIERNKALLSGGVRYLGGTLESYGNINTSDSLTALKDVVYNKKMFSISEVVEALKNNFVGYSHIRKALLSAPKYGNDEALADEIAVIVHEHVCNYAIKAGKKTNLSSYLVVIINNNTNSILGKITAATPDGRLKETFLANANSPFNGMDTNGTTAMLNSLVKLDTSIHAGSVQNMKFSANIFKKSIDKFTNLLEIYFDKGGSQAMITVLNKDDLENALINPEKYRNLIVRVGGFSARYVDLDSEVQMEILNRTMN